MLKTGAGEPVVVGVQDAVCGVHLQPRTGPCAAAGLGPGLAQPFDGTGGRPVERHEPLAAVDRDPDLRLQQRPEAGQGDLQPGASVIGEPPGQMLLRPLMRLFRRGGHRPRRRRAARSARRRQHGHREAGTIRAARRAARLPGTALGTSALSRLGLRGADLQTGTRAALLLPTDALPLGIVVEKGERDPAHDDIVELRDVDGAGETRTSCPATLGGRLLLVADPRPPSPGLLNIHRNAVNNSGGPPTEALKASCNPICDTTPRPLLW